jgi:hypothetical protein
MCQHRVTVKQCQNHQIILQKDSIVMRCESILGTERKWEFLIDKFFKPGVVTIDVTERWFNLMMMKIAPGPFEIHKHFILMNRKTKIEFTNMLFEEVVTWKQQENYFM